MQNNLLIHPVRRVLKSGLAVRLGKLLQLPVFDIVADVQLSFHHLP